MATLAEADADDQDFWSINATCLVRHHRAPRTTLFSLYDVTTQKPPIPFEYVDIRRETYTSLESPDEAVIYDTWWLPSDQVAAVHELRKVDRELSAPWTVKTMFNLLMNVPKPGFEWCEGEEIRVVHDTQRPGNCSPYNWSQLSKAQRKKKKLAWDNLQILEKPLRELRKRNVIPPEEADKYNMILADMIEKHKRVAPPAMPCIARFALSSTSSTGTAEAAALREACSPCTAQAATAQPLACSSTTKPHEEHPVGMPSRTKPYALVHTPIPIKKAMGMPPAAAALEAEWKKLEDKRAWLLPKVRSKKVVMQEARQQGKTVHFGSLMDLCFEKHSEQAVQNRKYKGRVVFRGDQVKDQEATHAVFNEQTSSSSHMASAKLLDAMARMPGFDGQDADAVGAYTQVVLSEVEGYVETWITLPPHRRPASWRTLGYDDPVVPLRLNLYGHPKAGLYWEQYCAKNILANGFSRMRGWDNVYQHKTLQLWLSVYVDDFKLVGAKDNIGPTRGRR